LPPTVVCIQGEAPLIETFIRKLDSELKCSVKQVKDGAELVQGSVYVTADPGRHVVVEAGSPPRLRLIEREPVDSFRPSADLLFGTISRAGIPSAARVLTGLGNDGAKGLKMLLDNGAETFVQTPDSAMVREAPEAAIAGGGAGQQVSLDDMGAAVLKACAQF